MERTRLGTSDVEVTPIIMDTWQAGKAMWAGIADAEATRALNALMEQGKIRAIGVSDFSRAGQGRALIPGPCSLIPFPNSAC